MKNIICTIIILFNISLSFSQSKEVIIIIDTLQGEREVKMTTDYGGFAYLPKEIETESINIKKFPNFISKKFQIHDTSTIQISISNKGDIIELKGFQKILKDTIRISKLPIIQNDLSDTTYTMKYWFVEKNDTLLPLPSKTEKTITISKRQSKTKINSKIDLVINQKKYSSSLITTSSNEEIINGSGTKPTNPYKKNSERKKNVKRFNIHSVKKQWKYVATIIL